MKLTPQQRIEAYKWAIQIIKQSPDWPFMCNRLADWCLLSNIEFDDETIFETFPELGKHKPEFKQIGESWFPDNKEGVKKRLSILDSCILMAEEAEE